MPYDIPSLLDGKLTVTVLSFLLTSKDSCLPYSFNKSLVWYIEKVFIELTSRIRSPSFNPAKSAILPSSITPILGG